MNSNKLFELEALRGIASIITFFGHFFIAFLPALSGFFTPGQGLIGTPFFFIINGSAAVIFFFVLSGFVLTYKYYRTQEISIITIGVTKRYFRLAGPVFIVIMLSYLIFKLDLYHYIDAGIMTNSPWLEDFAYSGRGRNFNPSLKDALKQGTILCFFRGDSYYNNNLWTMKVELIGSMISFALAPIFINFRKKEFIFSLPILLLLFHFINPYYVCFLLGSLLALFVSRKDPFKIPVWIKIPLILIIVFFFSYFRPVNYYSFLNIQMPFFSELSIQIYINTIASMIIIFIMLSEGRLKRSFQGRIGKLLGNLSFPLYLIHTIIICSFSSWFFILIHDETGSNYSAVFMTLCVTVVIVACATYILYLFDKNWVTMINTIFKKFHNSSPQSQ